LNEFLEISDCGESQGAFKMFQHDLQII